MKQHYNRITILRGIASLSIVLHHFTIYLLPQVNRFASTYTPFFSKSYLWVDFFFILSGFTISLGYNNQFSEAIHRGEYKSYLFSRLSRIYPLHIVTMLFMVLIEALYAVSFQHHSGLFVNLGKLHPPFTGKHNLWSLVTNTLLVQAFQSWSYWNEPAWFLSAMWMAYLFMPLMIMVSSRIPIRVQATLALMALLPLVTLVWRNGTLDFVTYKSVVRGLCEAYIGIFIYRIANDVKVKRVFSKSHTFLFLLLLIISSIGFHLNHVFTIILFPPMILSAVHASDEGKPRFSIIGRPIYYLGTISFSIYMVHWPLLSAFQQISIWTTGKVFYMHFPDGLSQFVAILTALAIVIFISHYSFHFLEQTIRKKLLD